MRVQGDPNPQNNGVFYIMGDQLGSTSVIADSGGNKVGEMRYMPWGETRYTGSNIQTDYHYTGQREDAGIGLYYYNARWYDAGTGRFVQADSIADGFDRYAYVKNSPVQNTDPSGHKEDECGFLREGPHKGREFCKPPPPPEMKCFYARLGSAHTGRETCSYGGADQLSKSGKDFYMGHEKPTNGDWGQPYNDEAGVCTVGYGHAIYGNLSCDKIMNSDDLYIRSLYHHYGQNEIDFLFALDLSKIYQAIRDKVHVPLTQWQFDALVDLLMNVGAQWLYLPEAGTLLGLVNNEDWAGVRDELDYIVYDINHKKIPNLQNRRHDEGVLFLYRDYYWEDNDYSLLKR
jgi:RHS repeat-associated protein